MSSYQAKAFLADAHIGWLLLEYFYNSQIHQKDPVYFNSRSAYAVLANILDASCMNFGADLNAGFDINPAAVSHQLCIKNSLT